MATHSETPTNRKPHKIRSVSTAMTRPRTAVRTAVCSRVLLQRKSRLFVLCGPVSRRANANLTVPTLLCHSTRLNFEPPRRSGIATR